jgi:cation:H+ antiporter
VGAVPIAYALAIIGFAGLPIDSTQQVELFLTAAQSIFAVSLLIDLRLGVREALLILVLFLGDFATSLTLSEGLRALAQYGFAGLYLLLAAIRIVASRKRLPALLRDGLLISPMVLAARPEAEAEENRDERGRRQ